MNGIASLESLPNRERHVRNCVPISICLESRLQTNKKIFSECEIVLKLQYSSKCNRFLRSYVLIAHEVSGYAGCSRTIKNIPVGAIRCRLISSKRAKLDHEFMMRTMY